MSDQKGTQHKSAELCFKCQQMYGHPNYKGMCSKCYKSYLDLADSQVSKILSKKKTCQSPLLKKKQDEKAINLQVKIEKLDNAQLIKNENIQKGPAKQQQKNNKCSKCSKKLCLMALSCPHCNQKYCKMHRLPQDHDCKVDFIGLGKKKLKVQNPIIEVTKIQKI